MTYAEHWKHSNPNRVLVPKLITVVMLTRLPACMYNVAVDRPTPMLCIIFTH